MAKSTVRYACQNCGAVYAKWSGRCANCGQWNTLGEQLDAKSAEASAAKSGRAITPQAINQKTKGVSPRLTTGISEVDLVLGGGIVPASVILVAGEPGIGKSTLILEIANNVARQKPVLYITAEESIEQVTDRAKRLGLAAGKLALASSASTDDIVATLHEGGYSLVIVDSIQTIATEQVGSSQGSSSQITNSSQLLIRAAKLTQTAMILVGHVTKEGTIAGPKLLEHLVDTVLNLEGDRYGGFKILRSVKNRYGSTNESGVFEMTDSGLKAIANPSAALLAERQASDGSVVVATLEGSRPLLVEIQALVNKTVFGYPKRTASGFDLNRLNVLIAMLERRTKLSLSDKDVYINVVGGVRITEPAADLAVCMAIATAAKGMALKDDSVVFGEVGLSGEVRRVQGTESRVKEASKLGFKSAIGPKADKTNSFIKPVSNVRDALNQFLSK
ncbi:MAG TPA: DNA repair protein RadA [Candidatus Saccharimonadales bacterium]